MNKILTCSFIYILLVSCNGNHQETAEAAKNQEKPVALQENKLDFSSYTKRSDDLVDDIYAEIAAKSNELKDLEADLKQYNSDSKYNEILEKYNLYNTKSERYYHAADYKLSSVKDSILRNKIVDLVKKSKNQYADKISNIQALMASIDKNELSINDYYSVLKIIRTLPVIEKYQKDDLPTQKGFQNRIESQQKLLEKIKAAIGKEQ